MSSRESEKVMKDYVIPKLFFLLQVFYFCSMFSMASGKDVSHWHAFQTFEARILKMIKRYVIQKQKIYLHEVLIQC